MLVWWLSVEVQLYRASAAYIGDGEQNTLRGFDLFTGVPSVRAVNTESWRRHAGSLQTGEFDLGPVCRLNYAGLNMNGWSRLQCGSVRRVNYVWCCVIMRTHGWLYSGKHVGPIESNDKKLYTLITYTRRIQLHR